MVKNTHINKEVMRKFNNCRQHNSKFVKIENIQVKSGIDALDNATICEKKYMRENIWVWHESIGNASIEIKVLYQEIKELLERN